MLDVECERLERIIVMISETIQIADDAGHSMLAAMLSGALDKANASLIDIGCG
jgi:hypothetical protein